MNVIIQSSWEVAWAMWGLNDKGHVECWSDTEFTVADMDAMLLINTDMVNVMILLSPLRFVNMSRSHTKMICYWFGNQEWRVMWHLKICTITYKDAGLPVRRLVVCNDSWQEGLPRRFLAERSWIILLVKVLCCSISSSWRRWGSLPI